MRFTSQTPNFPWKDRKISYVFVDKSLNVFQVGGYWDISHESAYKKAKEGLGKLIAVWPGSYTTDAFLVDNLDDYGAVFGFVMKVLPVKIIGYKRKTDYDLKVSKYVCFYLETKEDLSLSDLFITQFSMMIQKKYGWRVCTSKGYSSSRLKDGNLQLNLYVMPMKFPIKDSWGKCFE